MRISSKSERAAYVRNFIFGIEDSLVSTVGLVSGVASAGAGRATIFLTGTILIVVEALSMGVGSALAESSAEEYVFRRGRSLRLPLIGGGIMLLSYFFAGFIPLGPYLFFDVEKAFLLSVTSSLIALFLLGAMSASHFGARILRNGVRMLILGGLAIAAGTLVGVSMK